MKPTVRLILLFALFLSACGIAPAAPTSAVEGLTLTLGAPTGGVIQPLAGINIGPIPAGAPTNADLTDAYREVGVTMIRTHDYYGPLDMATMYPDQSADPRDPASYDFTASDRVFAAILAGRFEPYLRLGDSYNNGRGFPPANPRAPTNLDHWVQAAVEVTRHYLEMSRQAGIEMRYVEIWNEPDNGKFWDASPEEFFRLFDATARALKQEFPNLKVGGPGFAPSGALAPKGIAFTRGLLDYAREHQTPFDFFSWHMYSNDPQDYVRAAQFYRGELDARGFQSVTMHVTEWNTEARGRDQTITPEQARLGGRGAAILTASWIAMQQYGVTESLLYRGPDPALDASTFYGIFYADGRPKRAALAFGLWSEFAQYSRAINITLSAPNGLWILAGQDSNGEIAVLFANPTDGAVTLTLLGADGRPIEAAARQIVSDGSETVQESNGGAEVQVPAYAVTLVIVQQ
ncbi:MAG: hypothetical protein AB1750_00225 [Chloroflexota bacterium]